MIYIATQCFFPTVGGIEATMTSLTDHLAARGQAVRVFADGDAEDAARDQTKPYVISRFAGLQGWRRWRKRAAIAGAMKREAPRGVFADSWKSLDAIPRGPAPVAMFAHGSEYPQAEAGSAAKRARIVAALERADVIIANSEFTAERVKPFLNGRLERIRILLPPIEPQPAPSAEAVAQASALIGGGPVITTLARLEPRKGVDMTLRALPALLRRHPGLVYVIAGGGEDQERLKGLAEELGVTANVRFAGRVSNDVRAALLAATDIFAMPVRREGASVEGFGLSYVEAAWYGAPGLAGREGGAVAAVLDGETGLVCDGADPAAVEAALGRLVDDEPLRQRLGAAAAARARGFVWEIQIADYLALVGEG
ncbi:MAG TPA: glycosyltransferase family 4 protein [Caulobacteraceae bacterium]|jgi:phosphatidylinositol alpha-1,6-mannosyltransferase